MPGKGRVALVTGAGQRVGRAIAEALAADGWRIAAHYRNSSAGADELVRDILSAGGEAAAFAADLTDPRACDTLVRSGNGWKVKYSQELMTDEPWTFKTN